jgi:tricorn protease
MAALLAAALLTLTASAQAGQDEARLLRFPHIQGEKIAFVYGGDIWTASSRGGDARRVTSFDDGFELFPRISPDGEWIAFSGEYSGARQIWLVPYDGGVPRQLTHYPDVGNMPPRGGYDHLPIDWSPDGQRLLIRANRTPYGQRVSRYFWVDPFGGGLEEPLQIPEGGPASLSPDGTKLAYDIISREWRTWKRYRAGRAQDVWIYDLAADTVEQITDFDGTDNFPMWLGERIYYTSDRTGTLNLYRHDLASGESTPVTSYTDFDVLFPSRGAGGLIFQKGGHLHVMDAGTEEVRQLDIVLSDDRPWLRPVWKDGEDGGLGSYDVSPSASRVVVEFRGDLFDVPAEKGRAKNLTRTPERRERDVEWSPDGKTISYMAEVGDDYELFLRSMVDGSERQVTDGTGAWILQASWSPDSESMLIADKANRLSVLDVESGALREIDSSSENTIRGASWSGDSSWLTYLKTSLNGYDSVWIAPVEGEGEPVQVTTDHYDDGAAVFDPGGDYLYFASWRDFQFGDRSFEARLYALLLREDVESPLALENDVEEATEEEDEEEAAEEDSDGAEAEDGESGEGDDEAEAEDGDEGEDEEDEEEEEEPLQIDLDGLAERLVALPGDSGSYFNMEGVEGGFLFVEGGDLQKYSVEDREAETILEGVGGYMLTPDGKKLLYRHRRNLAIAKVSPGQKAGKDPLPMDGVRVKITPRTEWAQIYTDAWRIMRDWFYDPAMHGVDWRAMREKYRPLVDHVAHRDDLDFLLGELIGELNAGHTYVTSGESPSVARVPVGVLGCDFEQDGSRYRIAKIFKGRPWNSGEGSPLAEVGVDAAVGDYLISIDGEDVTTADDPYRHLENKVGDQVVLGLAAAADGADVRDVVVRPIRSEQTLRYLDWVESNRQRVEELSGGRIGYVHVPNTSFQGHRELWEGFTPQARVKQAMIIDDRYNGGGFIPFDMINSIAAPVLNYWSRRGTQPAPTPSTGFDGPMAMLINGYSSSGGDAFPFYFRKLGLGPLIGKTTWGGLIGYSGSPRMIDGGGLAVPAFSFINTEGEWDVEAVGVAPDIEVFDDPTLIQAGREPTLEAAVQYLLEELERNPAPARPATPAGPQRDK